MFKHISLAIIAAASISAAQAAQVTLIGDDFSFTYNDDSLFGTATVVGNSLVFLPTSFNAQSQGTGVVDVEESVIKVTVKALANTNKQITAINVVEKGDYLLGGDGKVRATSRMDVFSATQANQSTGAITATTGIVTAPTTMTNTEWTLDSTANLTWGTDTEVNLSLENTLAALSGTNAGDFAFIAKKSGQVIINVETSEVPVPAAAWLFGSALIALGLRKAK